jgi:hypothetical protein
MKTISAKIERAAIECEQTNERILQRFVVFAAGGKRPIVSFENYKRAERIALVFADLTNARMEVFDSLKEICYFIEPFELSKGARGLKT